VPAGAPRLLPTTVDWFASARMSVADAFSSSSLAFFRTLAASRASVMSWRTINRPVCFSPDAGGGSTAPRRSDRLWVRDIRPNKGRQKEAGLKKIGPIGKALADRLSDRVSEISDPKDWAAGFISKNMVEGVQDDESILHVADHHLMGDGEISRRRYRKML